MRPSEEDFCLVHGRDDMRADNGPIAYCAKCDQEQAERKVLDALAKQSARGVYFAHYRPEFDTVADAVAYDEAMKELFRARKEA